MSAARIVTTTEKFDETGKLVERITEEKFTEECGCRCGKQKENGPEGEEIAERKEIKRELTDEEIHEIQVSKAEREILEKIERMKSLGVPYLFLLAVI